MNKVALLLLLAILISELQAQSYTSYLTGDAADVEGQTQRGICLMGGAGEHDAAMQWLLERSGGGDILVIRASGSDGYNDYFYSELGVDVNSVETIVFNDASAATNPYVLTQIENAECIWMAGGDQWDYVSYWRDTAVEDLLNAHAISAPIGGTSAGMAILGEAYFSAENGTVTSEVALQFPLGIQSTVEQGDFLELPYLNNTITDTHYDSPDRRGRQTAFMAQLAVESGAIPYGIACDEYTAVCIDESGIARVFGEYPEYDDIAYFIQANCEGPFLPEVFESGEALTWNRNQAALKVYRVFGTDEGSATFDLNDHLTGQGGEWFHWWVEDGEWFDAPGTPPACAVSISESSINSPSVWTTEGQLFWSSEEAPRHLEIIDMAGRRVLEMENPISGMSLLNMRKGVYILSMTWAEQTSHQRLYIGW